MTSTLRLFSLNRLPIEASTAWYLNDLGEYRGKQELYTQQSPQRLKALRESAIIESAVSCKSPLIPATLSLILSPVQERLGTPY